MAMRSSPLASAVAALLLLAVFAGPVAQALRVSSRLKLLQAEDAPPNAPPPGAPPPGAPPPDAQAPDAPPPGIPPPGPAASLGDPIDVQPIPEVNSNLAPNCVGNNLIYYPPSNVYKVLNPDLASYYDAKVPQRPAGEDELFNYMIKVCNYLASVSTAPDGTRLCCRVVDLYGDFWGTQNVWGPVITGRLDYQKMLFNRGVNFTNVNATSQALLTKYTAWDPTSPIKTQKCSLAANSPSSQTCQALTFTADTNFQTQKTSSWEITSRVSLTATFSGSIPLVASASDSISVGASFNLSKSQSRTLTRSSSTSVSAAPMADINPGDCSIIASTKQQRVVTYQVRSRAPLAGPIYMYFSLSPSTPMNEAQFRAALGWDTTGKQLSALRLKGDPKFKVPVPVGKNQSVPQLESVGNWNAPEVTMTALGPYLNPWQFNVDEKNILSIVQAAALIPRIPGQAVTHPADHQWMTGKLGDLDYRLLRGDAVYIATAQDFVAAAENLGFVVDDYHRSLVDNSTYTKVDSVDITTYRNVVWTRPCPKNLL